ncbi:MAG: sulfotransferase, partial [Parvularculaceae bacterium]|nr:sulfotransferase [Parvularculaceae bacterium]
INLLAADPARRVFMRWEALAPAPPREKGDYRADPRYVAEKARLDMSLKYAPHIAAMHFEEADGPTECQFAMTPSFCAQYYDSMADIPSYRRWFFNTSYLPAFRYHKRLLQLLQANVGGRWTLKNPWHPLYLDDLVSVYPDAQLVMTHRDPAEVVGSSCSLIKAVRVMFSDDVDLKAIGEGMVETFDLMIARARAFKKKRGADAIHDVQYADLMKDPIGEMRKIYQRFDEPFTPEAERGMRAHLADNPQGKHGKHAYALEDYGLTRAGVRAHFADYIRDFGVKIAG